MSDVDARLVAALREQLARRPDGAARVGWKYGGGAGERIGDEIAVGHLTSATMLADGATYRGGGDDLHADVEVAVEVGADGAIRGYAVALELNDLADRRDPEAIVADNVFHRAVAFGPVSGTHPGGAEAALVVNGERRAAAPVPDDLAERIDAVGRVLASVGEQLEDGDRIITGLVVNGPVERGDEVAGEIGALGSVVLRIV